VKFVPNAVSVAAARSILTSQKHSPKTLFLAGIVGMGATVYLSCKATLKVEAVLDEHEKENAILAETSTGIVNNTAFHNREMAKAKLNLALDLGKLYGPAILCGAVSVAALAGSHNILSKRNAALAAAYGAVEKAFGEYRGRVREAYGEEKEQEIYNDVQVCEIEDPETGKKSKAKKGQGGGPYSFLFDEFNKNWEPQPEYNFMFLKLQQQYANDRLQARGHLFLNEILDALGLEHTKAGAVTGWIKGKGDDYVDFGIFEGRNEEKIVEFMIGREKSIWLNFNVDGTIYDKI
jgi:hypothetical protein